MYLDNSASKMRSGEVNSNISRHNPSSKLKTYGFTIAIIVGISGLAIGAAGLAGYYHVGTLSNMAKLDATIMVAAGGGGVILLILGLVVTIKNRQSGSRQQQRNVSRSSGDIGAQKSTFDSTDSIYGPKAWKKWKNIEVLDVIPEPPTIDLNKKDKILLYIPQRVRINGTEKDLTLKVLKEISDIPFAYFSQFVEEQFGDKPASAGWVLIDKNVLPESRGKDYETQKRMVNERGCNMPSVLEAVVLNLMIFALTGERLYKREPLITYTRCLENVDGQFPVVVGCFGSDGLNVDTDVLFYGGYGAACARRNFEAIDT